MKTTFKKILESSTNNVTMTLSNIIRKKKADNKMDYIVITRILSAFTSGKIMPINDGTIFDPTVVTHKELLDHVKTISNEGIVLIAKHLLSDISGSNIGCCACPYSLIDQYLRSEATD